MRLANLHRHQHPAHALPFTEALTNAEFPGVEWIGPLVRTAVFNLIRDIFYRLSPLATCVSKSRFLSFQRRSKSKRLCAKHHVFKGLEDMVRRPCSGKRPEVPPLFFMLANGLSVRRSGDIFSAWIFSAAFE